MAPSGRLGGRRQPQLPLLPRRRHGLGPSFSIPAFFSSFKKRCRSIIILLALIAILPPVFFHFRLCRFNQMRLKKCGWISNPPLVCAHGGDSTHAFPNTCCLFAACFKWLHMILLFVLKWTELRLMCLVHQMEFYLLSMIGRDLQRISKSKTSKVGYLSMKEVGIYASYRAQLC